MSYFDQTASFADYARGRPPLASGAWFEVRRRRILAFCIDALIIGFLCVFALPMLVAIAALPLGLLFAVGGLALSWFVVPLLFPAVALFYNGLTVSGPGMATPGMRLMDLEVRHVDGGRVPFLNAAVHAVFFYLSWVFPAVFLTSLVTSDKSCLHDLLTQVRVMRRLY